MLAMSKAIDWFVKISGWVAVLVSYLMLLAIVVGVIFRFTGHPIVGGDEIVEILLVVLIMFSLAYSESAGGHIKIDVIVNYFPGKVKMAIDIFSYLMIALLSFIITYVFLGATIDNYINSMTEVTPLFRFPIYSLKFICALGFLLWGLVALNKIIMITYRPLILQLKADKGESL